MRNERFYHSAQSAAESHVDAGRSCNPPCSAFALLQRIFPQGLEVSAYTLRKRLLCPRWWLIGVITQWLSKDVDVVVSQLGLREGDFALSGSPLNAKNFPLIVSLWTELLAQLAANNVSGNSVELNVGRILKGTAHELEQQREFLTTYLSSALRIQKLTAVSSKTLVKRAKSAHANISGLAFESIGLVQIVENVVITDSSRQKLCVTFTRDPRRLFSLNIEELLPRTLLDNSNSPQVLSDFGPAIVTLQPDVLSAMSRSMSPKKLISYLLLEMLKVEKNATAQSDEHSVVNVWRGRSLAQRELAQIHREQLAQARALYDHGLLSWENEAPRQRVRTLIGSTGAAGNSGIVHCWRLSQHAVDAVQFEQAVGSFLRSTAPLGSAELNVPPKQDLLPKQVAGSELQLTQVDLNVRTSQKVAFTAVDMPSADVSLAKPTIELAQINALSERAIAPSNMYVELNLGGAEKPAPKTSLRSSHDVWEGGPQVWSDDEFLMCVAEFYESLTPAQQQAFERERRRMSPEQFRSYVTPALMRQKTRNV